MARIASIERNTNETRISMTLNLDGSGKADIHTGIGFFDHMLNGFARHGLFDLTVRVDGDLEVDTHHTIEDTGIVLGRAIKEAVGDKKGIVRYGSRILPMDEALILSACDISGRACLCFDAEFPTEKIGTFDTELVEEFLLAFVRNCPMSLHIKKLAGSNSHHIAEGIFKAIARTLKAAVYIDPMLGDEIPSTKGVL